MYPDVGLLARIIEHTPIGTAILTPGRNIRYVNTLAAHLLGRSRDELLGEPIDAFLADRPGEVPWRELWPRILEGAVGEAKVGIVRRESEETTCALTAFYLGGRDGSEDAVAIIIRDVTHEIKIAEQLENKNVEMAKINTDLIRSNMELKHISEMKSNFLSIASHELKTPLTTIKGYSEIIIDGMKEKIDEGVFRMIESINRSADRLHTIINNMLDVTRIEQKKLRLKPEKFSLAALARDCIEDVAQLAAKRGISFNTFFPDDLPDFFADRMRMHQVFTNLLSNASKFSPDGSPIDVAIALEEHDRFHVTVKDRGIGIDKSEIRRIFDPFYEVADISKHSTDHMKFMGGGMGLGLSIAKGIVERHGGRIWAESEGVRKGEFPGSVFHVVLPVRSEMGWDDFERETAGVKKAEPEAPPQGEEKSAILIIDTDREAVEVARMMLENAFDIIAAPTGELGLSLAFQYHPSVILLDSYLPGLDGFRICSILRSQEETRDTPIIFLSNATAQTDIERGFATGADDFIVKPFSGRELVDKLWRLLLKKKEEAVK